MLYCSSATWSLAGEVTLRLAQSVGIVLIVVKMSSLGVISLSCITLIAYFEGCFVSFFFY